MISTKQFTPTPEQLGHRVRDRQVVRLRENLANAIVDERTLEASRRAAEDESKARARRREDAERADARAREDAARLARRALEDEARHARRDRLLEARVERLTRQCDATIQREDDRIASRDRLLRAGRS